MVHCAVYGCNNNSRKTVKDGKVSFYRFPKENKLKTEWVKFCCREDKFNVNIARICSDHFLPSDKHWKLQHNLLGYSPTCSRKIKPNAIPSQNGPKQQVEMSARDIKMEERKQREENLSLVRKALFASVEPPVTPVTSTAHDVNPEIPVSESPNISYDVSELLDCQAKLKALEEENEELKSSLRQQPEG